MKTEIKKNQWAKFFQKFNLDHQYDQMTVSFKEKNSYDRLPPNDDPFMGLALQKEGRVITGVQFFAGIGDSETVAEPVFTVKQPAKIHVDQDDDSRDRRITVRSKDGLETIIELGPQDIGQRRSLVEKVAYSIYKKRDGRHGCDADDWKEAEQKVKEAETIFVPRPNNQ